jgi:hypothetical protein
MTGKLIENDTYNRPTMVVTFGIQSIVTGDGEKTDGSENYDKKKKKKN